MRPEEARDDFKIGDTVYCAIHGKGVVTEVRHTLKWPVSVYFDSEITVSYTEDGRQSYHARRTLFFTPTSINEGSIKRPFVPKLEGRTFYFKFVIGKSVVATVHTETEDGLWLYKPSDDPEYNHYSDRILKSRIQSMQELSEEIKP